MAVHVPDRPPGISRRQLLTYMVAAPTLTVAVRAAAPGEVIGGLLGMEPAGASPQSPGLPDIVDMTDVLTLAAAPTQHLLVVEVTTANRVVVHLPRAEVGQGISTAVAILAAEELDARLADVDVVLEDARPELVWNQFTGGSNSVHALYGPMRAAAAAARARLVTAAAQRWGVPASQLHTADTAVTGPGGRSASYGSLSEAAAGVMIPAVPPTPKTPDQFAKIGQPTTRIDARDIVTGRAKYTLDLDIPGALPTVVARPPTINGTVASVDDSAARAMPGVVAVAQIPTGVAVTAQTFDQAQRARDALHITWNPDRATTCPTPTSARSSGTRSPGSSRRWASAPWTGASTSPSCPTLRSRS